MKLFFLEYLYPCAASNRKHKIKITSKRMKYNKVARSVSLRGQCHEIFGFRFSTWISFPQTPDYTIRAVANFFPEILAAQGAQPGWQKWKKSSI